MQPNTDLPPTENESPIFDYEGVRCALSNTVADGIALEKFRAALDVPEAWTLNEKGEVEESKYVAFHRMFCEIAAHSRHVRGVPGWIALDMYSTVDEIKAAAIHFLSGAVAPPTMVEWQGRIQQHIYGIDTLALLRAEVAKVQAGGESAANFTGSEADEVRQWFANLAADEHNAARPYPDLSDDYPGGDQRQRQAEARRREQFALTPDRAAEFVYVLENFHVPMDVWLRQNKKLTDAVWTFIGERAVARKRWKEAHPDSNTPSPPDTGADGQESGGNKKPPSTDKLADITQRVPHQGMKDL